MTEIRKIRKVLKSKPAIEGAGVHLKRVFGFSKEFPMNSGSLLKSTAMIRSQSQENVSI